MLIGSDIVLGPLTRADAGPIFGWRNTVEVMHLDGLYRPVSQLNFDEWFNSVGKDPSRVVFAIRRRSDQAFVGYVQISGIHPVFHSADLSIMIGDRANRSKGYGREALRLCIGFCWNELNLQRLTMIVLADNAAAITAYEKAGFEREGQMRRAVYLDGAFKDTIVMGLLRPVPA
jgi:RimJ/RimL family protein N-acetyltransferase